MKLDSDTTSRDNSSRAVSSLLRIAMERPDVLRAVFSAELPNAETVAAMQEARAMTRARFGSADELFQALDHEH